MKKSFYVAAICFACVLMTSCLSQERQKLIGTWSTTLETTDSEDNVDFKYVAVEKDTYKDNGDAYENGTLTFSYSVVDADYTTVVEYTYDFNTTGTWSIAGDVVTLERSDLDYDLKSTQFHLYDTESGQEMVPDTDYKNEVMNSIQSSMDEELETKMKSLKEPGTLTIVSISDTEMQMKDQDGVSTYKRVN